MPPPRRRGPGRVEAEHRPHGDADDAGAGRFAPQGLRRDHRSGYRVQTRSDALPARALGYAGRADGDGRSSGRDRGRLRPASASPGPGSAFSGPDDLRADRGRADRCRPFDLEAPGGAAPDRQAGHRSAPRKKRRSAPDFAPRLASASTTPARATPARPATRRSSAPTGSPLSAPGRANRALPSCAISWAGRRATRSTRRRRPICAPPISPTASSRLCRAHRSSNSPAKPTGGRICAPSA